MIFNLMAQDSPNGISTGALVALIICGIVVLAFAIFGSILRARDTSKKPKRSKHKSAETSATEVVEKKDYDFSKLTEEEKELIRKHRDRAK